MFSSRCCITISSRDIRAILLLLLPSISVPTLPLFELFLYSSHVVVAATTAVTKAAADDDDMMMMMMSMNMILHPMPNSLLDSEINCCRIN